MLEQKNKGRSRVKIAVFFVLAVHCIGLLALLVQGCNGDTKKTTQADNSAAPIPPQLDTSNTAAVVTDTNPTASNIATNPAQAEPIAANPTAASDYTIVSGDTYSTIARKFHVSSKAITEANPGVEPTKLRVGQKIHIPAATASAPAQPTGSTVAANSSGEQMYTVKSGDNLTTIARVHGTSVRALRAANSLTTDALKVGQKLKMPKGSAAAPVTTAANDTAASSGPRQ